MNLSGLVDRFGTTSVTLKRRGRMTLVRGDKIPQGGQPDAPLLAVVHPAGPQETQLLSQGDIVIGAIVLYTKMALNGTQSPDGAYPDRVVYAGELYEVQKAENWSMAGFYRSVAVKVVVPS